MCRLCDRTPASDSIRGRFAMFGGELSVVEVCRHYASCGNRLVVAFFYRGVID